MSGTKKARLLYMGQGSLRIITAEEKVIYIDPYAGNGYDLPADLILITHGHRDHNNPELIKTRNAGCRIITWIEALEGGVHRSFDLGYVRVEAVEAGNNRNHDIRSCVGFVLVFPDGISVYVSGDTSKTKQMYELSKRNIDYAFFCCDGVYNMDVDEAIECAIIVNAKHSIPYHNGAKKRLLFDPELAERFLVDGRLIVKENEEIELD